MNILILGASGFIGRYLYDALIHQGHYVMGASRRPINNINWQFFDFNQVEETTTQQQLQGIDLVINAVGILQQSTGQSFAQIQDLGPKKLFAICNDMNIKVLQISAIGAEQEQPITEFLASKRQADQALLNNTQPNIVLYLGIVLGESGKTTRQLSLLARLLGVPIALDKNTELPLISIEQLTDRIITLINHWPNKASSQVLIAQPETLANLLKDLRLWMGLKQGLFLWLPPPLLTMLFWILPHLSIGTLNKQSLAMLTDYSSLSYQPITVETASKSLLKNKATVQFNATLQLKILFYFNLMILSFIWLMSGISTLISFEVSQDLISSLPINTQWADILIIAAALGDIALGLLLLVAKLRRWIIMLQISVILMYSMIILVFMPELYLHPFTPIIKNMAMMVLAFYLLIQED